MTEAPREPIVDLERARGVGHELGLELDLPAALEPYASLRWRPDDPPHPTLQLDDISAIPFISEIPGVEEYQHRGRIRAGDHDVYVTVTPAADGYEAYCRERLLMGSPEHVIADPVGPPIAVAEACGAGRTLARLTEVARDANGMMVHPYMGIESVWELPQNFPSTRTVRCMSWPHRLRSRGLQTTRLRSMSSSPG